LINLLYQKKIKKFYLANIKGDFSDEMIKVNSVDNNRNISTNFIKVQSNKNKDVTLILCNPIEGVKHQILKHLDLINKVIINWDVVCKYKENSFINTNLIFNVKDQKKNYESFNINSIFIHLHSFLYCYEDLESDKSFSFNTNELPFRIYENFENIDNNFLLEFIKNKF
jgi:23S rRNA-/tRNA-specific pseudouridylate synthase